MKPLFSTTEEKHVIVRTQEVMKMAWKTLQGHYCNVCGMRKSNESFSGKGHTAHICKACSQLSPAQQAEQMTLRRLENLALRRLSESEMTWLKNRTCDHCPEVRELACMVYSWRLPHFARSQRKQELSITRLELFIDGEVYDLYGDPVYIKESYLIIRKPPSITRTQQDGESQTVEPQSKALAKLLKWTVHTLEIFCWEQDFCFPADVEADDEAPLWSVHVEYGNGEIQDTASSDYIPDKVIELFIALSGFFE